MVRPAAFGYNNQTAGSNSFQKVGKFTHQAVHELAQEEFDNSVKVLLQNDIDVTILHDSNKPNKPDAIFPNNWFSVHDDVIVLYPMAAANRRLERVGLMNVLMRQAPNKKIFDLISYESKGKFLEGTGSLVLDRVNRIAYACISPRTDMVVLKDWCEQMNYKSVVFHAELNHQAVYHTNVVMSIGNTVAVCCLDVINDRDERTNVGNKLKQHHQVVSISIEQMEKFAGNMLLVRNKNNDCYWVMSDTSADSLASDQKKMLEIDGKILSLKLNTIEHFGGGSARCMIAEIDW